jgi:hypothetical protein
MATNFHDNFKILIKESGISNKKLMSIQPQKFKPSLSHKNTEGLAKTIPTIYFTIINRRVTTNTFDKIRIHYCVCIPTGKSPIKKTFLFREYPPYN